MGGWVCGRFLCPHPSSHTPTRPHINLITRANAANCLFLRALAPHSACDGPAGGATRAPAPVHRGDRGPDGRPREPRRPGRPGPLGAGGGSPAAGLLPARPRRLAGGCRPGVLSHASYQRRRHADALDRVLPGPVSLRARTDGSGALPLRSLVRRRPPARRIPPAGTPLGRRLPCSPGPDPASRRRVGRPLGRRQRRAGRRTRLRPVDGGSGRSTGVRRGSLDLGSGAAMSALGRHPGQ